MVCTASAALEATQPESSSTYADEGTNAHNVARQVLTGTDWLQIVGVDQEMIEAVGNYVDYVKALAGDNPIEVEQRVDFSHVTGQPDSFGTADCIILKDRELIIVDLKYGKGVKVDATWNEQLLIYALGAIDNYSMIADFDAVRVCIVQPRIDHVDEFSISVGELVAWGETVKAKADEIALGATVYQPSEKTCRFCRAKGVCPALATHVHTTIVDQFQNLDQAVQLAPSVADGSAIARYLGEVDLIETWCKAIREKAYEMLAEGKEVPDYKLVAGKKGARAWADPAEVEATLKSMRLKTEEIYDFKLISPTTAEKLAKAGTIGVRQWPKLQTLITQPDGKPHVAPADDKRPAITIAAKAEDFEALT
jgi:hypothetical protein